MSAACPDRETMLAALELAGRAPSIHNSQPWRWRIDERSVHLYTDEQRWLPATDPDERDMLISCGAVLHHARVAFAALGWLPSVTRLPNPAEPEHLAALVLRPHEPTIAEYTLAAAIPRRRSDRRPYGTRPIAASRLTELTEAAAHEGVVLRAVTKPSMRTAIVTAIAKADPRQQDNPRYRSELATWSGRSPTAEDGALAANVTTARSVGDIPLRRFNGGTTTTDAPGAAGALLVLGTPYRDRLSRLRAGEATSAVMLHAARDGLATCALTQPLEVDDTERLVRSALGSGVSAQMLLRIGWPNLSGRPPIRTPRRHVADLVMDTAASSELR